MLKYYEEKKVSKEITKSVTDLESVIEDELLKLIVLNRKKRNPERWIEIRHAESKYLETCDYDFWRDKVWKDTFISSMSQKGFNITIGPSNYGEMIIYLEDPKGEYCCVIF